MNYTNTLRLAMHNTFRYGQGTRDMSGPNGFTTEEFVDKVAWRLERYLSETDKENPPVLNEPDRKFRRIHDVDYEALEKMFQKYDINNKGNIDFDEFSKMLIKLGVAPSKYQNEYEKEPDV